MVPVEKPAALPRRARQSVQEQPSIVVRDINHSPRPSRKLRLSPYCPSPMTNPRSLTRSPHPTQNHGDESAVRPCQKPPPRHADSHGANAPEEEAEIITVASVLRYVLDDNLLLGHLQSLNPARS